ncbi:hypothetical protein CCR75_008550 [Bremia lactucae]|uniref:Uncharacterized protein n=1 Tax=Bremia lactucae TaxID=4779 RepID=A0A976FR15_BRELC|nr:hypothetical protein CCR75_008550 [Bremia lactucae]
MLSAYQAKCSNTYLISIFFSFYLYSENILEPVTTPDKQKSHNDVLLRLIHDLEIKKTFCHVTDYPDIQLKKHGPSVNPVFCEQPAFFIDEGRYILFQMVNYGNEKVACEIARLLGSWSVCSNGGDRATTSQGAFIFDTGHTTASPLSPPLLLKLISSLMKAPNAERLIESCEMNTFSTASNSVG